MTQEELLALEAALDGRDPNYQEPLNYTPAAGPVNSQPAPMSAPDPSTMTLEELQRYEIDQQRIENQRRAERRQRELDLTKAAFEGHDTKPGAIGTKPWKELSRGQKVMTVMMALADVGAGYFGHESRSFLNTVQGNQKLDRDRDERKRQEGFTMAQMGLKNEGEAADDQLSLLRLGMTARAKELQQQRDWVQNLIEATPPESLHRDAMKRAAGLKTLVDDPKVADTYVPPTVVGADRDRMRQLVQARIREGEVQNSDKKRERINYWVNRVNQIMDSAPASYDEHGNVVPTANPLEEDLVANGLMAVADDDPDRSKFTNAYRAFDAVGAADLDSVDNLGRGLEAMAAQRAQKARERSARRDPNLPENVAAALRKSITNNGGDLKYLSDEEKSDPDFLQTLAAEHVNVPRAERMDQVETVKKWEKGLSDLATADGRAQLIAGRASFDDVTDDLLKRANAFSAGTTMKKGERIVQTPPLVGTHALAVSRMTMEWLKKHQKEIERAIEARKRTAPRAKPPEPPKAEADAPVGFVPGRLPPMY